MRYKLPCAPSLSSLSYAYITGQLSFLRCDTWRVRDSSRFAQERLRYDGQLHFRVYLKI